MACQHPEWLDMNTRSTTNHARAKFLEPVWPPLGAADPQSPQLTAATSKDSLQVVSAAHRWASVWIGVGLGADRRGKPLIMLIQSHFSTLIHTPG
jgi:hypothetical protein